MKKMIVLPAMVLLFGATGVQAASAHYQPAGYVQHSDGWRYRDTKGWDPSCFNLPYLSSQFACDAK